MVAHAGYRNGAHIEQLVSHSVQTLVCPEALKRETPRPGCDNGLYASMRRVLEARPVTRSTSSANPRIETEVAHELAGAMEATNIPDRGQERLRADHIDPGHRQQPSRGHRLQGVRGDQRLDRCDLLIEELDVAQRGRYRLLLRERQLELGEPLADFDPEQVREREPSDPRSQHGPLQRPRSENHDECT